MNKKIGIVGTGYIAGVHADALKEIEGAQITAVAGINLADAEKFIADRELAPAAAFGSGMDLVQQADVDAVYFCLPPFAHNGEVEAAAERGLHVFLEKPIAINSSKAEPMVNAIEKAGVISQVGFMMRFGSAVQDLKSRIDAGEVSAPTLFTSRFWVNMDGSDWWRDISRSGGQTYEMIIHHYDLACYLCGEPAEVLGFKNNQRHQDQEDYTIEDTSAGLVHFKNGALATITGSNCALPVNFLNDFRVVCDGVMLDMRCTGQPWVEPDVSVLQTGETEKVETVVNDNLFLNQSRHFIECLQNETQTTCPARDGLNAILMVEKIKNV